MIRSRTKGGEPEPKRQQGDHHHARFKREGGPSLGQNAEGEGRDERHLPVSPGSLQSPSP